MLMISTQNWTSLTFGRFSQKRFYNRERNSGVFSVIHQMSIKPYSLLCNLNNQPFLNSIISANYEKRGGISPDREILIPLIISLLQNLFYFLNQFSCGY